MMSRQKGTRDKSSVLSDTRRVVINSYRSMKKFTGTRSTQKWMMLGSALAIVLCMRGLPGREESANYATSLHRRLTSAYEDAAELHAPRPRHQYDIVEQQTDVAERAALIGSHSSAYPDDYKSDHDGLPPRESKKFSNQCKLVTAGSVVTGAASIGSGVVFYTKARGEESQVYTDAVVHGVRTANSQVLSHVTDTGVVIHDDDALEKLVTFVTKFQSVIVEELNNRSGDDDLLFHEQAAEIVETIMSEALDRGSKQYADGFFDKMLALTGPIVKVIGANDVNSGVLQHTKNKIYTHVNYFWNAADTTDTSRLRQISFLGRDYSEYLSSDKLAKLPEYDENVVIKSTDVVLETNDALVDAMEASMLKYLPGADWTHNFLYCSMFIFGMLTICIVTLGSVKGCCCYANGTPCYE